MRILQVIHTFMPESVAGSEVYTYLLSKALQARHEIAIFYRVTDGRQVEHSLTSGAFDGLPVYRIVNNWTRPPDFDWFVPGQEAKFEAALDATRADLVHFQFIGGGVSTSLPTLARRRGLPTLLTLHDFWPMCHRSHLMAADGSLCSGPEGGLRCAQCWLHGAVGQPAHPIQRLREVGLRHAVRAIPRFALDKLGLREYLPPVAYHTLRLMARDHYFRQTLAAFDLLIAPSEFLRQCYIAWGVAPERIRFVQNGIDPTKFAGLDRSLPLGPRTRALYIGQISRHKGLDVLIESFNQLTDAPLDLDIYGNTESSAETREYTRALRAACRNPHVQFKGAFPNTEVGRVLSTGDLLVTPSIWWENCPMTILEALYAGRPIVASNIGGMAELVRDGVNGYTFRVGDAAHLAERLRALAGYSAELLRLQRQITSPHTMSDVAAAMERCYAEILAHRSREEGQPCAF